MPIKVIAAVIAYLVLLLSGQLIWKKGLALHPQLFQGSIVSIILELMTSWYIVTGIMIYGLATVVWLYLLSKYELSYIYPITSLTFVLVLLVSFIFLGEQVPLNRWIGVFMICGGVYIISLH